MKLLTNMQTILSICMQAATGVAQVVAVAAEDMVAALADDDSKAQKVNIESRLLVHYDQVLTWLCRSDLSVT